MTQLDPRLISSLQELVLAAKAIGSGMQRSCWEIWGPPMLSIVITALGWLVIVWLNQKNNRDLLELQTKELARNRILDALDEYKEFLFDVEDPRRILERDKALYEKWVVQPDEVRPTGVAGLEPTLTISALATLSLLDPRQFHWRKELDRDSWVFETHPDIPPKVQHLTESHHVIMTDFFNYQLSLKCAIERSEEMGVRFLNTGRDVAHVETIGEQRKGVDSLLAALSTPGFLRGGRTARKPSGT
jgi:hypothetical protein